MSVGACVHVRARVVRTSALATLALTSPFIVRASRSSPFEKSALAVSIHLSAILS